ncbi:MAG: xanthine dehydrogenase family protein molybdopterin-binding subunit, partial [Actinomycetota bacterium]|nr:xanthine dehydrogenase family protein molybdopterin-binding subunit [Actinomycetota bacterium]
EDPRFLSGTARYLEDLTPDGALHAVFVRSIIGHAHIEGIDMEEARAAPGVVRVFDAGGLSLPDMRAQNAPKTFSRPILARDKVRFVGEPIAVVVAETRATALDAAERVLVDYDFLPSVSDPVAAGRPSAPVLFEEHGSNVAATESFSSDVAGTEPEVVIKHRFVNQRLAALPLEVNGALAIPSGDGLTLWVPCQAPFLIRKDVARALGLDRAAVRVIAPAVGGGFGAKIDTYAEHITIAALARLLGRPVRYIESRSENMTAMTHGRGQVQDVELGATRDGRILSLRADIIADLGAYPQGGAYLPDLTRQMLSGVYSIDSIQYNAALTVTDATPTSAYRGAGRPEAAALLERAVDMLAHRLDMDPADIRRKNFIPKDAFPFTTATNANYDSGDYDGVLDKALQAVSYRELREAQRRRRDDGESRLLGIGLCTYVEVTGLEGGEFGEVRVDEGGRVGVLTGVSPHGQGHETAFTQLVAGLLNVPFESIDVIHSDTALVKRGAGTMGSRSLQIGGSAIVRASEGVVDKARRLAAHLLEVSVEDVELIDQGRLAIVGAPERSLSWAELGAAAQDSQALPEGMEPGLGVQHFFDPEDTTYPFGAHVCVVEVDSETGKVELLRHVAVDDCGTILNPILVEGQVHGGIAQGLGQALFEEVVYGEDAQPLNANLAMYRMPSAAELVSFERHYTETTTHINPLGAKGIGESATIGSTPAAQNAVIDALSHLGVEHIDMPLTPERVWRALHEAAGR